MGLIASWDNSLDSIAFKQFKKILGINPMGLSEPLDESIDTIYLHLVKHLP